MLMMVLVGRAGGMVTLMVVTVMVRMRVRMIVMVIAVLWMVMEVMVTMILGALGRVCSPSLGTTNHNL